MRITVRVFGDLIQSLGRELDLDIDVGLRVGGLTKIFSDRAGESWNRVGSTRPGEGGLVVLVNGRNVDTLNGVETVLQDGDTVTLIPPFAGG